VAVPRISKEDLKARLESDAAPVVVDARLKYPYEHSTVRLPGAVRWMGDTPTPSLPRDREIVVYDSDPNELASSHVAAQLIRQGFRATALKGGIVEWLVGHIVPFMLSMALLALGSLIGRHYPVAVWWFFGAAGAAALCMAMFCLVLFVNVMEAGHQEDSPDE
jgi:rhodanese-related sulfurtransferase